MNHIYHTRGFVLASFPHGEYNKRLVLLTSDFGVIRVTAQAVRKIESKLRTSIQDYAEAEFFLVHGKTGWRLTNTSHIRNLSSTLSPRDFQLLARVFSLIIRLIPEEDNASKVCSIINEAIEYILKNHPTDGECELIEILMNLKILGDLGYIEHHAQISESVTGVLSQASLHYIDTHKKVAIKLVNQAIQESHL